MKFETKAAARRTRGTAQQGGNMKIKTLVRCRPNWTESSRDGSAIYMLAKDGWQLLGILRGSCGPHGESTGIFAECKKQLRWLKPRSC